MVGIFTHLFDVESRVENLKKFKDEDGDCPTLVCTDLAARGLDLDVDHVIMFDFPKNSVSMIAYYLVSLFVTSSHSLPFPTIILINQLCRLIISIELEELHVWVQKVLKQRIN